MSSVVREWTQRLSYERTTQGRPWSCHSREQWYNGPTRMASEAYQKSLAIYPWGAISHSWDPSAASLHTRAGDLDPANDQCPRGHQGGGGDELPASNEDGDPNPTNSDPTGPTNTAVGSGKHQGGPIVRVNPQWSGCLTPMSLLGWVWQLCVPGVQQYRPLWR